MECTGIDTPVVGRCKDPAALHRLLEAVEAAKRRLSSETSTSIDLPFWEGQRSLTVELSRQQFEDATADLRARLWPPLERMGRQAFVQWTHRCLDTSSLPYLRRYALG